MKFKDHLRSMLMPKAEPGMPMPGITLYGDSIMYGVSLHLSPYFMSFAQPGSTAADTWRRFAYDKRSTKIVVLQPGTNDLTIGEDPVPFLKLMAERCIAEGRQVIFTGITQRDDRPEGSWVIANLKILELAKELKCVHLHWEEYQLSMPDDLHPDRASQARLAASLQTFI